MSVLILDLPCLDHGKTKSLTPEGYALKKDLHTGKCTGLHRLVYCESRGIPVTRIAGMCVRHKCDNTRCIEPSHLELGTWGDNNRDRAERGRSAKVVPSRHALTKLQAQCIQARYNPRRDPHNGVTALAREFGVDSNVIYSIVKGEHSCLL